MHVVEDFSASSSRKNKQVLCRKTTGTIMVQSMVAALALTESTVSLSFCTLTFLIHSFTYKAREKVAFIAASTSFFC